MVYVYWGRSAYYRVWNVKTRLTACKGKCLKKGGVAAYMMRAHTTHRESLITQMEIGWMRAAENLSQEMRKGAFTPLGER